MPRYIDACMLKEKCVTKFDENDYFEIEDIDAIPTADVQEVKHAHWECVNEDEGNYMCDGENGCGHVISLVLGSPDENDISYCPFCGAKMDGDKND